MGIETVATPLDWFASLPHQETVKMGGMRQFLYRFLDDRENETDYPDHALYFGDELEFMLIVCNNESSSVGADESAMAAVDVDLCAHKVLAQLREEQPDYIWMTEYADYMVEAIAGKLWRLEDKDFLLTGINIIQESMHERRWKIFHQLQKIFAGSSTSCQHHTVVSFSCFPALGAVPYAIKNWQSILDTNDERTRVMAPGQELNSLPVARSLFLSDAVTSPHVRYQTLTRNMRLRKGAKMCSLLPVEGTSERDIDCPNFRRHNTNIRRCRLPFCFPYGGHAQKTPR